MTRAAAALTAAVAFAAAAPPAAAADFPPLGLFRKKPKPEAAAGSRAKQAVATLQSDPDERKRVQAAEELRGFDARQNPDVIPGLIVALQKDPSTDVRSVAVDSIGKIKPSSPTAAVAMELALQTEPDPKVREAIKGALFQYHLSGYRSPPAGGSLATRQSAEPPFAAPRPEPAAADVSFKPITNSVGKGVLYTPTAEPPLARPKPPAPPAVLSSSPPSVSAPALIYSAPPPAVSVPGSAPAVNPLPSIPVPPTSAPAPLPSGVPSTALPAGLPPIAVPSAPTIPLPPPSKPSF